MTGPDLVYYSIMVVRNVSQAKTRLSALIELIQKSIKVVLVKARRLIAYRGTAHRRTPGSMAGQIWIAPDFDVLPADMAEAF